jgi:hypothetical protein
MKLRLHVGIPAILISLLFCLPAHAAEVDFSCMSFKVWGKGHVSDQFKSYDIVIKNECPGAVYWAMCIERLDHDNHTVVETHNPAGYVEVDKKARVNLQMKRKLEKNLFHNRYQAFYVDIGYAIEPPATPSCHANSCEQKKRGLRAEIQTNEAAWKKTENHLDLKIEEDCPNSGWDAAKYKECSSEIRELNNDQIEGYVLKDDELRAQMAAIDPENCQVYSGELANH